MAAQRRKGVRAQRRERATAQRRNVKNCRFWHLCILTVCTVPAGLLAQARPATGVFTGIVVDTARRPLSGVQVLLSSTRLLASTGADGRFRTLAIAYGKQTLLLRRIGFRPRTLLVDLRSREQALDTIRLEEVPLILPELGVEARLVPPGFFLEALGNLDNTIFEYRKGYWRYLGFGASMSSSHAFLAILQTPYTADPPGVQLRGYLASRPSNEFAGRSYGSPCWDEGSRPALATALDEPPSTYRILSRDGLVFGGLLTDPASVGDCIRSISLSVPRPLATASPVPGGWAVVSAGEQDSARLRLVNLFGRETRALLLREVLGRDVSSDAIALSPSGRGTHVTLRRSPYLWVEVDSAGLPLVMGGPFETPVKGTTQLRPERVLGWISHGVLPIERGFIQQLEKPDRTARLLILYDLLGRSVGHRGPAALPLFIASKPEQRRLLGIHYMDPWGRNTRLYEYSY